MTGKEETGIFTLYSDVEATAVRWLWYPFIAVGKITLLQVYHDDESDWGVVKRWNNAGR